MQVSGNLMKNVVLLASMSPAKDLRQPLLEVTFRLCERENRSSKERWVRMMEEMICGL